MRTGKSTAVAIVAGLVTTIATAAGISLLVWSHPQARAAAQNLGSPNFVNPPEIRSRTDQKVLRGVLQMANGQYQIPSVGTEWVRQFQGWAWDPSVGNKTPPRPTNITPGPTLRARVGDQVQLAFLNKIDNSVFPYTFVTGADKPPFSSVGCDQAGVVYPGNDIYPNCFHGSSTANIHFHGTHTDPDGLGDNVLVQILPDAKQRDWNSVFEKLYRTGRIPQTWTELASVLPEYTTLQMDLIREYDTTARQQADKNGLPLPESLYDANMEMIHAGQWPQYLVGAFPNFLDLPPYTGKGGKYKAGQAPGTHWYHAHKHGSTSLHILNGLAGAFVIESTAPDGYDQTIRGFYKWGDSYGDHEKVLVFQQYDVTQNLERLKNTTTGGPPPNQGPGSKRVLVNGLQSPTINMRPGEVQLWRMVNGTEGNRIGVIPCTMFQSAQQAQFQFRQTAQDGVQFSPNNYKAQPFLTGVGAIPPAPVGDPKNCATWLINMQLAGGNRADVLVQAPPKAGVYTFVGGGGATQPLFFVNVTGQAVSPSPGFPTTWPEMPDYLDDLPAPTQKDITNPNSPVNFQWEKGRTGAGLNNGFPPKFMINGKQFGEDGEVVDQCMPLDGLQDWVLVNYTTPLHPFHIHINPFQVLKIEVYKLKDATKPATADNVAQFSYSPPNNWVWQDVIYLPAAIFEVDAQKAPTGKIYESRVTIRQTYVDFTGTYVLHCHILAHEDRGMMQLVRVVPAHLYPNGCQKYVPSHH